MPPNAMPPDAAQVRALLRGLPHALLLQDSLGELHALLPSTAKPVLLTTRRQDGKADKTIGFERCDPAWLQALGPVRHHLCALM